MCEETHNWEQYAKIIFLKKRDLYDFSPTV